MFAGRVKIVGHSSCRTGAILKYFCPLGMDHVKVNHVIKGQFYKGVIGK